MKLSEEQIEQIWADEIRSTVFEHSHAEATPITVFLGGQPGAGKTAHTFLTKKLNPSHQITPIVGDDYRQNHPDYYRLLTSDLLRMPKVTGHADGRWIALSADYANQKDYSASIEGTWRHALTVLDQAEKAKELGRVTHALIIATPPIVSRTRALARFVHDAVNGDEARWTSPQAQEKVFSLLSDSVRDISLSHYIDRFTVASDQNIIFDSLTNPVEQGWKAWKKEYARPLTDSERNNLQHEIESINRAIPLLENRIDGQIELIKDEITTINLLLNPIQQITRSQLGQLIYDRAEQDLSQDNRVHRRKAQKHDRGLRR